MNFLFRFRLKTRNVHFVKGHLKRYDIWDSSMKGSAKEFNSLFLRADGQLLLRVIHTNCGDEVTGELIKRLFKRFLEHRSELDMTGKLLYAEENEKIRHDQLLVKRNKYGMATGGEASLLANNCERGRENDTSSGCHSAVVPMRLSDEDLGGESESVYPNAPPCYPNQPSVAVCV